MSAATARARGAEGLPAELEGRSGDAGHGKLQEACPHPSAASPTLSAEFVSTPQRLRALSTGLDDLLARTGAPASARWPAIEAGLRNQPGAQPWCMIVHAGRSMAAALVARASYRNGAWVYRSATHPGEPGWLPATDATAAQALAVAIREALHRTRWPWLFELRNLPADALAVSSLCQALTPSVCQAGPGVPRLHFQPGAGLETGLSRNTRSAVARARKRIAEAGLSFELEWFGDAVSIESRLGAVIQLHRQRNLQLRGAAGLDDLRTRTLFVDTVRCQAQAGRARLLTLRLDGALAAFALCFESVGSLYVYSNMASPDWLDFSPGTIANAEVVRTVFHEPGLQSVDWGIGLQRYKLSGEGVRVEHLQHLRAWSSEASHMAWAAHQSLRRGWQRCFGGAV